MKNYSLKTPKNHVSLFLSRYKARCFIFMGYSKYSNETKAICIDNKVVDFVRNKRKEVYKSEDGELQCLWYDFVQRDELADCATRLLRSRHDRYVRCREKIYNLIVSNGIQPVFITLTFRPDVLAQTSPQTRRKYVERYLKQETDFYVANVDYSPKKHREHYHAVVSNRCNLKKWKYGFSYAERVRCHDFDVKRVSQYVVKLTSHAFKTDNTRLIYSRNVL